MKASKRIAEIVHKIGTEFRVNCRKIHSIVNRITYKSNFENGKNKKKKQTEGGIFKKSNIIIKINK